MSAALVAFALVAAPVRAQDDDDEDFTPRSSAPPAKRTGGASRSENAAKLPSVTVLATADSVGLTAREQPVILWSLSADTDLPVEIAINDPNQLEEPVLLTTLKGPTKAGLHRLDLAKVTSEEKDAKPVKLQPGVKYDVVIAVNASENASSENPSATCRIMRVDPKDAPAGAEKENDPLKRAAIYGKSGLWFDYVDALYGAVEAKPKDEALGQKWAKALASQRLVLTPEGKIAEQPVGAAKPKK